MKRNLKRGFKKNTYRDLEIKNIKTMNKINNNNTLGLEKVNFEGKLDHNPKQLTNESFEKSRIEGKEINELEKES